MRFFAFCAAVLLAFSVAACGNDTAPSPPAYDVPALQSSDLTVGTGAQAAAGRTVTVHYTLWLYDPTTTGNKGTRLESSRDRNQPFPFVLGTGGVIRGWDQGVPGMRVGGTRQLTIPSALAYGSSGSGSVPPNSALVFEIELLNVQ